MTIEYGAQIAAELSRTGDTAAFNAMVRDCNSSDKQIRATGLDAHYGAMRAFAIAFAGLRDKGVKFAFPPVTVERLAYAAKKGGSNYAECSIALMDTFRAIKKAMPGWYFDYSPRSESDQRDKSGQRLAEAKPLEVKIVGMPERVTTTEVDRDGRDNITTTRQTEKDVPLDQ